MALRRIAIVRSPFSSSYQARSKTNPGKLSLPVEPTRHLNFVFPQGQIMSGFGDAMSRLTWVFLPHLSQKRSNGIFMVSYRLVLSSSVHSSKRRQFARVLSAWWYDAVTTRIRQPRFHCSGYYLWRGYQPFRSLLTQAFRLTCSHSQRRLACHGLSRETGAIRCPIDSRGRGSSPNCEIQKVVP